MNGVFGKGDFGNMLLGTKQIFRDEADYVVHMDYIHYNPVKHGWVETVKDWPYSTFHQMSKNDIYPIDWSAFDNESLTVGERS